MNKKVISKKPLDLKFEQRAEHLSAHFIKNTNFLTF